MSRMFEQVLKEFEARFASLGEPAVEIDEKAPPGMEPWIKKNKDRFKKQYGAEKGMEILYATAWRRHEANESGEVGAQGKQATMKDKSDSYLSGGKLVG